VLCELWKRLDGIQNLSTPLDEIINESENLEPWREAIVRTPAAIGYCTRRLIRKEDSYTVFLLQTTRMNGTHGELFTYCFYVNSLIKLNNDGHLKPLQLLPYQSIVGIDTEPGISLSFPYDNNNLKFKVEFHSGQFVIYIWSDKVESCPLIEEILLKTLGFQEKGSIYCKWSKLGHIESSVRELSEKLATFL
jgi:hypothetical protein